MYLLLHACQTRSTRADFALFRPGLSRLNTGDLATWPRRPSDVRHAPEARQVQDSKKAGRAVSGHGP